MSEKIEYEDLIIPNLVDPSINTLNSFMAQYLIDAIYQGKNVLITGSSKSGRTLLLNVLGKSIDIRKKLIIMEMKPELLFLEHKSFALDLANKDLKERSQEYFIITKGFPYYEEYDACILDDVPKSSYFNLCRILLSNKQTISVLNEDTPQTFVNNMLTTLTKDLDSEKKSKLGIALMEKIDIIIHIRRYEDDFIRIKEICETQGYDPTTNRILLEKIFEFKTNGQKDNQGQIIGEFLKIKNS